MSEAKRKSLREQILAADDLPREAVEVPEWGLTVWVRTITASQRDAFEGALSKDQFADVRARLAAYALCDEDGSPLFTDADIKALGQKSAAALTRISEVAMRLNAVTTKDLDELEKNSAPSPSE